MTPAERFPRAARYNPAWIAASTGGAANALWMAEWLAGAMRLEPGMRVLDLGCGRAATSIFLRREFGVEVWAVDLWFDASENYRRVVDAGADDGVFPIQADARALPFAAGFFDAIVSIDSFPYYGTDEAYLGYLARFVRPGGGLGHAGSGLTREIVGEVPAHLRRWWTPDLWGLHSADWWRNHWGKTGIVEVELADSLEDGCRVWLDWHRAHYPDNVDEIDALEADGGEYLGYVRVVARRTELALDPPIGRLATEYRQEPLFRPETGS